MKILIVVTSHAVLGNTEVKTGLWLEEVAVPYLAFTRAGAQVDIASPRGGAAPIDPKSDDAKNTEVAAFRADAVAMKKLSNTLKVSDLTNNYQAIFVAGGHGTMWDLPTDASVAELLSGAWKRGAVVSAVCHGPAALVSVKDAQGQSVLKNRAFTAFSNEEEAAVGLTKVVPFLLETRLVELGGRYEKGAMWKAHVVQDGRLVTGQNPASSFAVAEAVIRVVREAAR